MTPKARRRAVRERNRVGRGLSPSVVFYDEASGMSVQRVKMLGRQHARRAEARHESYLATLPADEREAVRWLEAEVNEQMHRLVVGDGEMVRSVALSGTWTDTGEPLS